MQKGVSAILASVLIVLVVISLSGAFLIYTQRTSTQLTESVTAQQQTLQQQLDVQFILEGVSGSQASLRNIGENDITYGTLSIFLDDILINYTLTAPIQPGKTGTVYLNQTWKAGLGERTLRVSGRSLSDSVRVRVERPTGNVLDLRFEDNKGRTANDDSGNSNIGTLSGTLFGDFEGTLDGFILDCNPPPSAYVSGVIGQAIQIWRTVATENACIYKTISPVSTGYTVWFYGKGYVEGGIWFDSNVGFQSYLQDVETGCRTANGDTAIYAVCNGDNAYTDWRLFKVVAYANSVPPTYLYFYANPPGGAVGQANSASYDFVTDGPVWTNGRVGKALRFDGYDDYVDLGTGVPDTMEAAGTLEAWVLRRGNSGGILSRSTGGGWVDERLVFFLFDTSNTWGWALANGVAYNAITFAGGFPADKWMHLVWTWDGSRSRVYWNGVLYDDRAETMVPELTGVKTWIGRTEGLNAAYFNGLIDEVRVYNRAYAPDDLYIVNRA